MDYSMNDSSNNIVNNNNNNDQQLGSYNKNFVYPSGSKSAESGVITRFKQRNGPDYSSSSSNNNNNNRTSYEENRNLQSHERASTWFESHPYVGEMPQWTDLSRASSRMSCASVRTNATNISNCSELSIITDISQLQSPMVMDSGGGGYPSHNTYPPPSFSPYQSQNHVQRQDPNVYLENLIKDIQRLEFNCHQQLLELRSQAKTQFFELVQKNSLETLIYTLLYKLDMCNRVPQVDEKIVEHIIWILYYILHNVSPPQQGRAKAITLRFIRNEKIAKPALTILLFVLQNNMIGFDIKRILINIINTLIVENKRYPGIKAIIQQHPDVIRLYMTFIIQRENKNIYSICMDSLARIISGSDILKNEFLALGGIEIVLGILRNNHQEKILYRAAELLHTVVSCQSKTIILKFIWNDGINTCAQLLDHGSPRLLHKLASCIRSVSDCVDESMNIENVIASMVKLIGIQDHVLESMIIGCLGNFISKKDKNKALLCHYQVPKVLMRSLMNFNDTSNHILNFNDPKFPDRVRGSMKIKAELLDNILFAFQSLTNTKNDKLIQKNVCKEIMSFEGEIWTEWFLGVIAGDGIDQVRRAINIVSNILTNVYEDHIFFNDCRTRLSTPRFYKTFVIETFNKFYLSWKWYANCAKHRWEECSQFRLFLGEQITRETWEDRKKNIFNLLSQSLKLIRILIHSPDALKKLTSYLPKDFPLPAVLSLTPINEDMFQIARTLAQFSPELCKRWNTLEIEKVITDEFSNASEKSSIKEAAQMFHNVLWPPIHNPHYSNGYYT